ncbi:MAG: glycosyltransferase family 2 protein [Verrucomicrobiaceae bacterium]|nr:MAG: glycosyltransferase family 2 protein [Verrucomicrobiaceae bacterium]
MHSGSETFSNLVEDRLRANYTALIRTYNSEKTLSHTLGALNEQTEPPDQYVFVDSGSTDATLNGVPAGSIVHRFSGTEFSFSEALNQGVELVETEFVLIISSHTVLGNRKAISYALTLLEDDALGAVYFSKENGEELRNERIDRNNFDGFNGLWNTCALVRMSLLRQRGFNREAFSAEDQEWAHWLFHQQGKAVARISGGGVVSYNERHNIPQKRLNEYVAVAYFVNRKLLGWRNLVHLVYRAVQIRHGWRGAERLWSLMLVWRLFACRFKKPKYQSRYF